MLKSVCRFRVVLFLAVALPVLWAPGPLDAAEQEQCETVVVMGGEPLEGVITAWNAEGFSFRLADTGDVVDLNWETLNDAESRRLKKLVGMDDGGSLERRSDFKGKQIEGIRVHLKTGRAPIEGVQLKDEPDPDAVFIRTNNVKRFRIPRKDIAGIEKIVLYEGDIYSPDEIYQQRLLSRPPTTAQDHYELALLCRDLGLFIKAREHLSIAELIDPRYGERVQPMMAELQERLREETARSFLEEARRARTTGNPGYALEIIEKARKFCPDHPYTYELIGMTSELEEMREEKLRRDIVLNYYIYHEQFLRKMATGYVTDGEDIPGLLVYLKDGRSIRGMLKQEDEELIVLEKDNVEYRIDKRNVSTRREVNLNTKKRKATFDEARAYATDPEGGISADIRSALARRFAATEDEIRQLWADRVRKVVEISTSTTTQKSTYATVKSASYGPGIWLREGGSVGITLASGGRGGNTSAASTLEIDPEKWWDQQRPETRYQVLEALSAEAIMDVIRTEKESCRYCGGKGIKTTLDSASSTRVDTMCPYCRGFGYTIRVVYR